MRRRFPRSTQTKLFRAAILESLEGRTLLAAPPVYPLSSLPLLHSNPTATAKLYLDFDGDAATTWNGYTVPATPAYSLDSDTTTYSDWELSAITEIWARVAEKYSPFNLDVTTQNPGTLADNVAFRIVIGGDGKWYSATAVGGTTVLGGFYDSAAPNTGYVFEENLLNGDRKYTAEAIAHEAGHGFGLEHQSLYNSDGTLNRDHNRGDANTAPIMGTSYYSARGLWWNGTTSSSTTLQDDLSMLANLLGYRTDDVGNTAQTAKTLTFSANQASASGIIEKSTDLDYFAFTISKTGGVSFTINPAAAGPMLDLSAEIRSSSGTLLASAATSSLGENIGAILTPGTYYLVVKSAGGYGDVGQYTLSGSTAGADPGGPYTVAEGGSVGLSANVGAGLSVLWDLDKDGVFGETGSAATRGDETGPTPTFSAAGLDGPASWPIQMRIRDGQNNFLDVPVSVSITNVAPTPLLTGNGSAVPGTAYSLSASASDPGTNDTINWSINWGDGTSATTGTGRAPSFTHTYATIGTYTITAVATDNNGGSNSVTKTLSVSNLPPNLQLAGNASVAEGTAYALSGTAIDPATSSTMAWSIDWGDNSAPSTAVGAMPSFTHTYADNGSYTITATGTDKNSVVSSVTKTVTVTNVAPTPTLTGNASSTEGAAYALAGLASDPGSADTISWSVNWGDASTASTATGRTPSFSHTYADNGTYTITATATDKDGGTNLVTKTITTTNVAPVPALTGNVSVVEGAAYALAGTVTDPGTADTISWSINWGDASTPSTSTGRTPSFTHSYADNGTYTIIATATDKDGASNSVTKVITVTNAAPTAALTGNASVAEGTTYALAGTASDAGINDTITWSVNWGDGSAVSTATGRTPSFSHAYADNGSYTVTATVTDKDGATGTATKLITVTNLAPTPTLTGAASSTEGSAYALSASATDPGVNDTITWSISWGDGSSASTAAGKTPSFSHSYADSGTFTITATATDKDGGSKAVTKVITVANVTPTPALTGATTVNEGTPYSLSASATDPGTNDTITWSINWGDSSTASTGTGRTPTVTHTYADNGSYTITATATDKDGGANSVTKVITVSNVGPPPQLTGNASVNEGANYVLSAAANDPGTADAIGWSVNWGDASTPSTATGVTVSLTHAYADNGTYTITATATDKDGASKAVTKVVTVTNVAPTPVLSGNASVAEGAVYSLGGTASDPGSGDTIIWSINWGDTSTASTGTGRTPSFTHTYADNGTYTITATATDKDGGSNSVTKVITVTNVAPTPGLSGNASASEGSLYSLGATASDPGINDTVMWSINWGDASMAATGTGRSSSFTHTYADNGTYTITATATDNNGGTSSVTKVVTVTNVAPTPLLTGNTSVAEGSAYGLDAAALDPGSADTVSWSIDWGDGAAAATATGRSASLSHTYVDNGTYTITATATDDDGGTNTVTQQVTVNNVAPSPLLSGDAAVAQGTTYALAALATDPGTQDSVSWSINWGDNSAASTGTGLSPNFNHVFAAAGTYTITATASDNDGGTSSITKIVTVSATAPTLQLSGNASVNEGSAYALTGSATVAGAGTANWTINWGDSSTASTGTGANPSFSHTYADNGTYTITATATDGSGGSSTVTQQVTVTNVAPTPALVAGIPVAEGSAYALDGSVIDPGTNDTISWSINWGDGSTATTGSGRTIGLTHTYGESGSYTITLTATDKDGATGSATQVITVANIAPTPLLTGNPSVAEGSAYSLGGSATDPGSDDVITWSIDWGDATAVSTGAGRTASFTHAYADNGSYTITTTATDSDGDSNAITQVVTVTNAAPSAVLAGNSSVVQGTPYTLDALASDPGTHDTITWSIDWGDGSAASTATGLSPALTHTYATIGSYTITATATDNNGDSNSATHLITVANAAQPLQLLGDATGNEGSAYALAATATPAAGNSTITWTINWGDATSASTATGTAPSWNHTYVNNGTYTITATVKDSVGGTSTISKVVSISNVAPTAQLTGNASANEGSSYSLSAQAADPGTADAIAWSIDWGDGTAAGSAVGRTPSFTHTYANNGGFTITAKVSDKDGGVSTTTKLVTVNNVAPTGQITGNAAVNEGASYSLGGSVTDPGSADIITWSVNWGDGSSNSAATGRTTTLFHTFVDNGSYTITATASDKDGGSATFTKVVTVNNVNPTAGFGGVATAKEGAVYLPVISATDPGSADVISWSVNWGDSSTPTTATGRIPGLSHTYVDNGTYTITAIATDDDGGAQTITKSITVSNVVPVPAITGNSNSTEGSAYGFTASATDPGVNDTITWSVNWGDASPVTTAAGRNPSFTHTYVNNGTYTISATATDKDGGSTGVTKLISVINVAPSAQLTGLSAADEGSAYSLSGTASDPGVNDVITWSINWGDRTATSTATGRAASFTHTYANSGNYTITATVSDKDGGSSSYTKQILVNNVAPTPLLSGNASANEGSSYSLGASATDPGTADTITWSIDWGDNTADATATGRAPTLSHVYADSGSYTITAIATDKDGGAATVTRLITINNLPPTGQLTGNPTVSEGAVYTLGGTATDPSPRDTLSWSIDWGDGSSASTSNGSPLSAPHTYADNGAYTITATVTDKDGAATTLTKVVTVSNVAPIAQLTGGTSANEGEAYAPGLGITDPGSSDTISWSINWGDGSAAELADGRSPGVTHVYADNRTYTFTAVATDKDGGTNTLTRSIVVRNVAPTPQLLGEATVNIGAEYALALAATDPGVDDLVTWSIDWGDGSPRTTAAGLTADLTHIYAQRGSYTISATATDNGGASATITKAVRATGIAPLPQLVGDDASTEGAVYVLSGSVSGPVINGPLSWSVDWGDGSPAETGSGDSSSWTHTYANDGTYTIRVLLADADGGTNSAVQAVSVANLAPVVQVTGLGASQEGAPYALGLLATDAGSHDVIHWSINWGDASPSTAGTGAALSLNHTYANSGTYLITITAADEDGGSSVVTRQLDVANVPPTPQLQGASSVQEGSAYALRASAADPGTGDTVSWLIDWGDGSPAAAARGLLANLTHVYVNNGTYTISATATDSDGGSASVTRQVQASNAAPSANLTGNSSLSGAMPYTLRATATDPGSSDTIQWSIDWGDGSAATAFTGSAGDAQHRYVADGTYTIRATATDSDGASSIATKVVRISGTGGGQNSTTPDTTLEGWLYSQTLASMLPTLAGVTGWTIDWGDGTPAASLGGNAASASHAYANNGTYTLSVVAQDQTGSHQASKTMTVLNVSPSVTLSGNASVPEGTSYSLGLLASDPGSLDTITWTIDWGDGHTSTAAGRTAALTHAYDDNGSYTIQAVASDSDGGVSATMSAPLTVTNVAPTPQVTPDSSAIEGSPFALQLSATDPGQDDAITWTIDWGDQSAPTEASGRLAEVTHAYADNGTYLIVATASDNGGGIQTLAWNQTVANAAPTIAWATDENTWIDTPTTFAFSASDAGDDRLVAWAIDWGDGQTTALDATASTASHTYANRGIFSVTLIAVDEDGPHSVTQEIKVRGTSTPTASASAVDVTTARATQTFSVTYSDIEPIDLASLGSQNVRVTGPHGYSQLAHLMEVQPADDGSVVVTYQITSPSAKWSFADNGSYTLTQEADQVLNESGNAAPAAALGTFSVNVPMVDLAGNTPTAAKTVTSLKSGSRLSLSDYVGPTDPSDYYKLRVLSPIKLTIKQTGTGTALQVLKGTKALKLTRTRSGTTNIYTVTLAAGTYYLKASSKTLVRYGLSIQASAVR